MTSQGLTVKEAEIVFELHALKFTPYAGSPSGTNSISIIKDVMNFITRQRQEGKGYLIDRHKNRENEEPRELFLSDCVHMLKERRMRCTIALLRSGRKPLIKPADEYRLIPLDTSQGSIAEKTHFYVDYSLNVPILCIEYNYHGPRASDIEFYLRNIARDQLKISKATELTVFMDTNLDKAISELANVLDFEIKAEPKKLQEIDKVVLGEYLTGMINLGNKVKPRFIKVQALFQTQGKTINTSNVNKDGVTMIRKFLNMFKANPQSIDCFDNFVVKYEDKFGNEEVLSLMKGKKAVAVTVDTSIERSERQWYELIQPEFDKFIETLKA